MRWCRIPTSFSTSCSAPIHPRAHRHGSERIACEDGSFPLACMKPPRRHREGHRIGRIGWLRAAVLGANDGIVSTSSLVVGIAASGASHAHIVVTGVAGLVAGAMSVAGGGYVSGGFHTGIAA